MGIVVRTLALLGFLALAFNCPSFSDQLDGDKIALREMADRQQKKKEAYRKLYNSLPSVNICGRVVDQYGDPVPRATVTVEWKNADEFLFKFSEIKVDNVLTDAEGNFKLRCNKPLHAWASAEKNGYAPLSGEVCDLVRMHNQTLEAVPAVIILRKRGAPTFLLSTDNDTSVWVWAYSNTAHKAALNIFGWIENATIPSKKYEDIIAGISYDDAGKLWTVTYSVTPGNGIICSNECLYEAPPSGYSSAATLVVTNGTKRLVTYMYLRSRSPAVWSRIELDHDTSIDVNKGVFLRIVPNEIRMNPYGDRNLEYDDRFKKSWRAREELTKEAVTAISQGRLPEKCKDVPARIKAANERK